MNLLKRSWDLEIIEAAALGTCRFDDFQRYLGISRKVLSARLKELFGSGVLERRRYQAAPVRYEYRLTEKGRELLPILSEFTRWTERWQPGNETAAALCPVDESRRPMVAGRQEGRSHVVRVGAL